MREKRRRRKVREGRKAEGGGQAEESVLLPQGGQSGKKQHVEVDPCTANPCRSRVTCETCAHGSAGTAAAAAAVSAGWHCSQGPDSFSGQTPSSQNWFSLQPVTSRALFLLCPPPKRDLPESGQESVIHPPPHGAKVHAFCMCFPCAPSLIWAISIVHPS